MAFIISARVSKFLMLFSVLHKNGRKICKKCKKCKKSVEYSEINDIMNIVYNLFKFYVKL